MSDKYTFIRGEEGNYSVRNMSRWARVSRAGYYEWRDRPASATAVWRRRIGDIIEVVFADSDGTYGYRRVAVALARLGRPWENLPTRSLHGRDLPDPGDLAETVSGPAGAVLLLGSREEVPDQLAWLDREGVRNIEMEGAMLAGYLNHWGFPRFAMICTTLLNRLEGDQVTATPEELHAFSERSGAVLFNYLRATLS